MISNKKFKELNDESFENTVFNGCVFENLAKGAVFDEMVFKECRFENAENVYFNECKFENCVFENIKNVTFDESVIDIEFKNKKLYNCEFSKCNVKMPLEDFVIEKCEFYNTDVFINRSKMYKVQIHGIHFQNVDFLEMQNCILDNNTFENCMFKSKLSILSFMKCKFQGSVFNTYLKYVSFDKAEILNCDFENSEFDSCGFEESKWDSVNVKDTKFLKCRFQGSVLKNIDFTQAFVKYSDFTNCMLYNTEGVDVKIKSTDWIVDDELVGLKDEQ
jgi:uncharacterized protein YjbI with pentapeptide repeats